MQVEPPEELQVVLSTEGDLSMEKVEIQSDYIKLDQFLKWCGIADNGSMAKLMILDGLVQVNSEVCLSRGKKIRRGDVVDINGIGEFKVY